MNQPSFYSLTLLLVSVVFLFDAEVEAGDEAGGDDLFDDGEELVVVGGVVGEDAEGDFAAGHFAVAAGAADAGEGFVEGVADVDARVGGACGEVDGVIDDTEDDGGFDAFEGGEVVGGLGEGVAVGGAADVADEGGAADLAVLDGGGDGVDGGASDGGGGEFVEEVDVGVFVEEAGGLVFGGGGAAEEAEGFAADGEEEGGGERTVDVDVECANVFGEDGGGCACGFAVVDELCVNLVGRVVVDDDVDGRALGYAVVRAGCGVVDEREKAAGGAVLDERGVERLELDVEEVDERAVLLVGDVAAVEDAVVVDAGCGGDAAEGERARETVGVGVVVADDCELVGVGEEVVERRRVGHECGFRLQIDRRTRRRAFSPSSVGARNVKGYLPRRRVEIGNERAAGRGGVRRPQEVRVLIP